MATHAPAVRIHTHVCVRAERRKKTEEEEEREGHDLSLDVQLDGGCCRRS